MTARNYPEVPETARHYPEVLTTRTTLLSLSRVLTSTPSPLNNPSTNTPEQGCASRYRSFEIFEMDCHHCNSLIELRTSDVSDGIGFCPQCGVRLVIQWRAA